MDQRNQTNQSFQKKQSNQCDQFLVNHPIFILHKAAAHTTTGGFLVNSIKSERKEDECLREERKGTGARREEIKTRITD